MSSRPAPTSILPLSLKERKPHRTTAAKTTEMVSKIIKRTPTKSSHRRKKSPLKNVAPASSIVAASINKSMFTCQRRLIKIITKFTKITTPNLRKPGFRFLKESPKKEEAEQEKGKVRRSLFLGNLLPPSKWPEKKTVLLDLDETLIHSKVEPSPDRYDFVVHPKIEGEVMNFYILKRPGLDELLEAIGEKFEIVVFTAGLKEYASLVLDRIDPKGVISHRLYRDSCKEMEGNLVKDLSELGRDLKRVVIIDDNPNAYALQPENALPVRSFIDDLEDQELRLVIKFFEFADCFKDMRDAVKHYLSDIEGKSENRDVI